MEAMELLISLFLGITLGVSISIIWSLWTETADPTADGSYPHNHLKSIGFDKVKPCIPPMITFEEAWAEKEKEGYQYGGDALQNVKFGWEIRDSYCKPETLPRIEHKLNAYTNAHGSFTRPSMEMIFMSMAVMASLRSTCSRKKVGAVFTDEKMLRVLCFGYNGNAPKAANQCDSDEPGACGCLHAELVASTKAISDMAGSTCFVTLSPCKMCSKLLLSRNVRRVVYLEDYRDSAGIDMLRHHGVVVEKYSDIMTS